MESVNEVTKIALTRVSEEKGKNIQELLKRFRAKFGRELNAALKVVNERHHSALRTLWMYKAKSFEDVEQLLPVIE